MKVKWIRCWKCDEVQPVRENEIVYCNFLNDPMIACEFCGEDENTVYNYIFERDVTKEIEEI
jgi:hypothetical protein